MRSDITNIRSVGLDEILHVMEPHWENPDLATLYRIGVGQDSSSRLPTWSAGWWRLDNGKQNKGTMVAKWEQGYYWTAGSAPLAYVSSNIVQAVYGAIEAVPSIHTGG